MSWDIKLKAKKDGEVVRIKRNMKTNSESIKLGFEDEVDFNVTYNFSPYYYEAADNDERFEVYEGEYRNGGIRALNHKSARESVNMLKDMIERITQKYQRPDGTWINSKRTRLVLYDENGKEIADVSTALVNGTYARKEQQEYTINEGDASNYWEPTAINAIKVLEQMLFIADMFKDENCEWEIS